MAHKKGQGSTRNGRDSRSKRRGVKAFGGQVVRAGSIIVRTFRGRRLKRLASFEAGREARLR